MVSTCHVGEDVSWKPSDELKKYPAYGYTFWSHDGTELRLLTLQLASLCGALLLLAEIDREDAEGQQPPADRKAPRTVAEVCVTAGGLVVGCGPMDVRAGIGTRFCHCCLLAWWCWKQRAEGHLLRPIRPTPGPRQQTQVTGNLQRVRQQGQTQDVAWFRVQYVARIKA